MLFSVKSQHESAMGIHIFYKAIILQLKNKFKKMIGGRNISNLRYVDDTTLMAESEEEVKSLLIRVKESERVGLNLKKKQNT